MNMKLFFDQLTKKSFIVGQNWLATNIIFHMDTPPTPKDYLAMGTLRDLKYDLLKIYLLVLAPSNFHP